MWIIVGPAFWEGILPFDIQKQSMNSGINIFNLNCDQHSGLAATKAGHINFRWVIWIEWCIQKCLIIANTHETSQKFMQHLILRPMRHVRRAAVTRKHICGSSPLTMCPVTLANLYFVFTSAQVLNRIVYVSAISRSVDERDDGWRRWTHFFARL